MLNVPKPVIKSVTVLYIHYKKVAKPPNRIKIKVNTHMQ